MEKTTSRPTWDQVWLQVAHAVAQRSRCTRASMGAVIVSAQERISATGYNGAAASYKGDGDCVNWCERARGVTSLNGNYDGCPSIHAEANALLYVDRSQIENGTIYVTAPPCMHCAKLISNSGLRRVVVMIGVADAHRTPEIALDYLRDCGITVTTFERDAT
jgi:dCMP deaminase